MSVPHDGLDTPSSLGPQARIVGLARLNGWVVEDIPPATPDGYSRVVFHAPDGHLAAGSPSDIVRLSTRWTTDGWWSGCSWRRRNGYTGQSLSIAEAESVLALAAPNRRAS